MALSESGVLPLLTKDVSSLVCNSRLYFMLKCCQLNYKKAYLTYHRSLKVAWSNEIYL